MLHERIIPKHLQKPIVQLTCIKITVAMETSCTLWYMDVEPVYEYQKYVHRNK